MAFKNKTYVAADWDNDIEAVEQLYKWNESSYYSKLDFINVHDYKQSNDSSLCCTIKRSLRERINMSKTFILIVGKKTNSITKGSCQYCKKYSDVFGNCYCSSHSAVNYKSYIETECDLAIKNKLNIVVLYNANVVNKSLCPIALRNVGIHVPMKKDGIYSYSNVKEAILNAEK